MDKEFIDKRIKSFKELQEELYVFRSEGPWIFRGEANRDEKDIFELKTGLERACVFSKVNNKPVNPPEVEWEMIREFRRWYDGSDRELVRKDTLYCLSLMQHYGAPTRLLDWTYSPFVAAYFAFEKALRIPDSEPRFCTIWCLNTRWCDEKARDNAPRELILSRGEDKERDVFENPKEKETFTTLYNIGDKNPKEKSEKGGPPYQFILKESPLYFHSRLYAQQSIFVCPGDVSQSFMDNLKSNKGWNTKDAVVVYRCDNWRSEDMGEALEYLWYMNISRATLFPGLEGFAESMMYRIPLLQKKFKWRWETAAGP